MDGGEFLNMGGVGKGEDFYVAGLMDLSAYSLQRTEPDGDWDRFVDTSPQGTIFTQSEFLRATGQKPSLWYCRKNKETVGAVALVEDADGKACIHSGLLVYSGVLFRPGDPNQNSAQTISEQFRITSSIIRGLTDRYRRIEMAVHHSFKDLRPFLWHNYGEDKPQFDIALRYTSLVDLTGLDPASPLSGPAYLACNKSRRQEIRYAQKAEIETKRGYDRELFEELYRQTFAAQDIEVPENELTSILAATDGLNARGRLRMYASRTPGADVGSIAIFGQDAKRAYYLYGANNPTLRSGHTGTAVLWDAFQDLASETDEVDLEGINSPKRGYFKLSFGGSVTPYHIVRLNSH